MRATQLAGNITVRALVSLPAPERQSELRRLFEAGKRLPSEFQILTHFNEDEWTDLRNVFLERLPSLTERVSVAGEILASKLARLEYRQSPAAFWEGIPNETRPMLGVMASDNNGNLYIQ